MTSITAAPLVEISEETVGILLRAAREQFDVELADRHRVDANDPVARREVVDAISAVLTSVHDVCVALEDGEVGQGMYPADAVKAAAEWALEDVESRLKDDSGWTITTAAATAAWGRKLQTLIETCER